MSNAKAEQYKEYIGTYTVGQLEANVVWIRMVYLHGHFCIETTELKPNEDATEMWGKVPGDRNTDVMRVDVECRIRAKRVGAYVKINAVR